MFSRVLIANRGEIACRIIRTCRRLGIDTVAVYSQADANAQHVRRADCAYPIGGPRPADSYLRGDAIIAAARDAGAQAIHPGYGFLSENADFAQACAANGLVFIGPSAESMRRMGSKAGAKDLMAAHGVPVVPGYTGEDQDPALLAREAQRIGFPLLIKAAYGGGGKGMRIVRDVGQFSAALESCQREARNAFGRDRVLLERYIETPRHIEFQIFGDSHGNVVHLNERECSAQRRYQKVLEETPSPFLSPELRAKMGDAAIAAGRALGYANAGTVEFIVAPNGDFHFMEINTRLQVEHPVTEMTLHLDLVELQLRVAAGEALPASLIRNKSLPQDGHALEVRLYAEDPAQNFLPGSGTLQRLRLPQPDAHVRVDSGVVQGDTVTIFYDPMIAKLITWDQTRAGALQRMREALAQCEVRGPKSNIAFLERLVRHPAVVDGSIDTGYLDRNLEEFLPAGEPAGDDAEWLFAAATACLLHDEAAVRDAAAASADAFSPWARADAFRLGHPGKRIVVLDGTAVQAHGSSGAYALGSDARTCEVAGAGLDGAELCARYDGLARRFGVRVDAQRVLLHGPGGRRAYTRTQPFAFTLAQEKAGDVLRAPMSGRVVVVNAQAGDEVAQDQELLVMEAMKMELSLKAPRAGRIETIGAQAGDFVEADTVLVHFEAVIA